MNLATIPLLVLVIPVLCDLGTAQNIDVNAEEALFNKLFQKQAVKHVLPRKNEKPVQVTVDVNIRQIVEVDAVNQAIRVNLWLRIFWNNPLLAWKKSDYNNIDFVYIDKKDIWIPDLAVYNEAVSEKETPVLYERLLTKVMIHDNGDCSWFAPTQVYSQCHVDVTRYPYDKHSCQLTFGSWMYDANQMSFAFINRTATMNNYITSNQWELDSTKFTRNDATYADNEIVFPDISLRLELHRLPLYEILNIVVPTAFIVLLAFLSFILPVRHKERIFLCTTVLLIMSIYMLMMTPTFPHTSNNTPRITIYFVAVILELVFCLIANCLTIKVASQEGDLPRWLESFVDVFGRCCCMRRPKYGEEYVVNDVGRSNGGVTELRGLNYANTNGVHSHHSPEKPAENVALLPDEYGIKVFDELNTIADYVREMKSREERAHAWKKAARIMDRLFLFVFLVIFILLVIVFFV